MLSSILFGGGQRYIKREREITMLEPAIKANVIASAMQHAILETYKLPDSEYSVLRLTRQSNGANAAQHTCALGCTSTP